MISYCKDCKSYFDKAEIADYVDDTKDVLFCGNCESQNIEERPDLTSEDWSKAGKHLSVVREQYEACRHMPGVNVETALSFVIAPLAFRFDDGERTTELYDEIMHLE